MRLHLQPISLQRAGSVYFFKQDSPAIIHPSWLQRVEVNSGTFFCMDAVYISESFLIM